MTGDEYEIDALRLARQMLTGDPASGASFSFAATSISDIIGVTITLGTMYAGAVIALQRERGEADPQAAALTYIEASLAEHLLAEVTETP